MWTFSQITELVHHRDKIQSQVFLIPKFMLLNIILLLLQIAVKIP